MKKSIFKKEYSKTIKSSDVCDGRLLVSLCNMFLKSGILSWGKFNFVLL
jgi:hypothetical protein